MDKRIQQPAYFGKWGFVMYKKQKLSFMTKNHDQKNPTAIYLTTLFIAASLKYNIWYIFKVK